MLVNSIASWEVHKNLMEKIKDVFPKAIVYKGFWTSQFYDEPYLRFISDVDLLVRWEDYERAIGILEEMGFQRYSDIPRNLPAWLRKNLEWETSMRKGLAMVEIHIRPFPPYFLEIDMDDLFENATPWFGNFLQIDVEYNLFLNVLHFYKSTRRSVFHILDALILSEMAHTGRLKEILKKHGINERKFFHVLRGMLQCRFPMESPFYRHGFYFARNKPKAILTFLLTKALKRIYPSDSIF